MKRRYVLSPSLDFIERSLLGVSDGLLEAVERGETSTGIAAAVRQSPEWTQYQSDIREASAELDDVSDRDTAETKIPNYVLDLIRRKVATNTLPDCAPPAPGQIVSVEKIVTARPDELDAFMSAPLFVLLDAPAEVPGFWHGWLASGETDYASWWDFVLQEVDAPFDPAAGMIQLWNPVQIYFPQARRIVAVLSPARLQAVRALAAEFATAQAPANVPVWPGRVATRITIGGMQVETGSPVGGDLDVRHRYQQIYFEAADAVREPARIAMRKLAAVPEGQIGTLLKQFIAAASRLKEMLVPEPRVAVAMGAVVGAAVLGSDVPDLSWPSLARIRVLALTDTGDGRFEVSATGSEPITVDVRQNGQLDDRVVIEPGGRAVVSWNKVGATLSLKTPSGRSLEFDLSTSP